MLKCCDAFELLNGLDRVPLILTDIPYGEISRKSNGLRNLDKEFADVCNFDVESLAALIADKADSCYIFCGTGQISSIRKTLTQSGMSTRVGIWQKSNPSPMNGQHIWLSGIELCVYGKHKGATFNRHCENTVWKYPVTRKRNHPTPKPVSLFQFLIETSSNPGDIVCDPFVGGGTTAIAAKLCDRDFICGDINPMCIQWTQEWLDD